MRGAAITAVSIVVLAWTMAVGQAADKFTVGDWQGQAHFADGGTFSRCTVELDYKSGITVNFGLTRDYEVEIWVDNPAWKLNKNTEYDVQYWIDGNAHQRGIFNSLGNGFGRIDVDNDVAVFDQLRNGTQLFVAGLGKTETFRLDNTSAALTRMRQCVDTEIQAELDRALAAPNNPTATAPRNNVANFAGNPKGPAQNATDLIVALFEGSPSLAGFLILKGSDIPKAMRNEEIVWKAPDAMGSANRYVGESNRQIADEVTEADRKACDSGFSTDDATTTLPDGSAVLRFGTACSGGHWYVQYSAYEGRNGVRYVIGNFSLDAPDGAKKADATIYAAIAATAQR